MVQTCINKKYALHWLDEMAQFFKMIDPYHIVLSGTEGLSLISPVDVSTLLTFGDAGFEIGEISQIQAIDVNNIHIYPCNFNLRDKTTSLMKLNTHLVRI